MAREAAATIQRCQSDDVWCPECWWWNHVSLRCPCKEKPALLERRRDALRQFPIAPGDVFECAVGTVEVIEFVEKDGLGYVYCRSNAGEVSVPLRRLQPPDYRLVRMAPTHRAPA